MFKNFAGKICRGNQNTNFMFNNFAGKICRIKTQILCSTTLQAKFVEEIKTHNFTFNNFAGKICRGNQNTQLYVQQLCR